AERALESVPVSAEVRKKLEAVADAQVKARGRIARPTALLIDKSGSMSQAIEIGKRLGSLLAAVADKELFVYAFDSIAYPVESAGPDLAAWERALTGITAGGNTSVGVGVEQLRRKKQYVEQIVVVTDEGENAEPRSAARPAEQAGTAPGNPGVSAPAAARGMTNALQCPTNDEGKTGAALSSTSSLVGHCKAFVIFLPVGQSSFSKIPSRPLPPQ